MSVAQTNSSEADAVLEHHLGSFAKGIEEILADYTEESVLITTGRAYKGLSEIRDFFSAFLQSADATFWAAFQITDRQSSGDVAYLAWESKPAVPLATDTLYVKNRKIAVQTFTAWSVT